MKYDYQARAGVELLITVTATDDGVPVALVGLNDATYAIADGNGAIQITRTLGDGIVVNGDGQLVITIGAGSTFYLHGDYHHELTIVDALNKTVTLLYGQVSYYWSPQTLGAIPRGNYQAQVSIDGTTWTDISGQAVTVQRSDGDQMVGEQNTADGTNPIVTGSNKKASETVTVVVVYTEGPTEAYEIVQARYRGANKKLWFRWAPAGGIDTVTGNNLYTCANLIGTPVAVPIINCSIPDLDAGSGDPAMVEFSVRAPRVAVSTTQRVSLADYVAYAGNDLTITVTAVDDDNIPVVLIGIVAASYAILTLAHVPLVIKSLADGIAINGSGQVVIEIARADTLALSGDYRHELTILDSHGVTTTLLDGLVEYQETVITT